MLDKAASLAVWIACIASLSARPRLAGWDDPIAYASHLGGMHFDRTPGNLEVSDFGFHALLPDEISLTENLTLQPAFDCRGTILRFNQVPTSIPIDRNNLETFSVYPSVLDASGLLVSSPAESPWMFGAWARTGVATDFRDIGSDDLTFDLAGGAGYRFHERLSVGFGAAVTNLSGDVEFYPGLGFDWQVSDRLRIGLCGPNYAATYTPEGNWSFSIRSNSTGEIWNISDDEGKSRDIDFKSYRIGFHLSRRVCEQISISAGAGVTFANEIGLNRSNGDVLLQQRLDSGFFGQLGLTITAW
ncbi:MAG: DUF6268 family outer membrane beta-barrel protein [Verrucomicrobiota bacterium]